MIIFNDFKQISVGSMILNSWLNSETQHYDGVIRLIFCLLIYVLWALGWQLTALALFLRKLMLSSCLMVCAWTSLRRVVSSSLSLQLSVRTVGSGEEGSSPSALSLHNVAWLSILLLWYLHKQEAVMQNSKLSFRCTLLLPYFSQYGPAPIHLITGKKYANTDI